jgi:hypothetical protein
MRYIHDAPRSLAELFAAVGPNDACDLIAFSNRLCIPLSDATEPETVEAVYAAWCADPNAITVPALS